MLNRLMPYYIMGEFKHIKIGWYGIIHFFIAVTSVVKTYHSIFTEIPID